MWARLRSLWRAVCRRSAMEQDMADELAFHLERRIEDLMRRRGLPVDEARRVARLEFGSIEKHKDEARRSLGVRPLDELRADLRYAWRSYGHSKVFTAAVVATFTPKPFDLGHAGSARNVRGLMVSGNYFGTLGVAPAAGRLIADADDRRGCVPVAVLSHAFWQTRFGGAPAARSARPSR